MPGLAPCRHRRYALFGRDLALRETGEFGAEEAGERGHRRAALAPNSVRPAQYKWQATL